MARWMLGVVAAVRSATQTSRKNLLQGVQRADSLQP